jgi:hypothetical protein
VYFEVHFNVVPPLYLRTYGLAHVSALYIKRLGIPLVWVVESGQASSLRSGVVVVEGISEVRCHNLTRNLGMCIIRRNTLSSCS